ncbi:MAG TPA: DUF1801 domain-containing protein [Candidatus Limnocylindrales bacterium]
MGKNPDVDAWFAAKRPRAEAAMQRVREIILAADRRVEELVQYGSVQFAFQGSMASFVQTTDARVNLMFHRGARIKGAFPHLEGDGPSARFMRFADLFEVDDCADELTTIVHAWCSLMTPPVRDPGSDAPGRG